MAKSRTDPATDDRRLVELSSAIEQLGQRIEVLTSVVDRLHDELQWQNNQRWGDRGCCPPPPLRSMPADPATDDWQLNRVSEETVTALRDESTGTQSTSRPQLAHEQLCHEIAELRQIVAALVLISSDHGYEDLSTAYDWMLEWASQGFDPEILRESLSETVVTEVAPAVSPAPVRSALQATLFAETDASVGESGSMTQL